MTDRVDASTCGCRAARELAELHKMLSGRGRIWSITDIATYLGYKPQTVRRLKMGGEVIAPDGELDGKPYWYPQRVRAWARRTGRIGADGGQVRNWGRGGLRDRRTGRKLT